MTRQDWPLALKALSLFAAVVAFAIAYVINTAPPGADWNGIFQCNALLIFAIVIVGAIIYRKGK